MAATGTVDLVPLSRALDDSSETYKVVADIRSSTSPAVQALWRQLSAMEVDVADAEALGGGDVVVTGTARSALALAEVLNVGRSVADLIQVAAKELALGANRDGARRAVLESLLHSKNGLIAELTAELMEET